MPMVGRLACPRAAAFQPADWEDIMKSTSRRHFLTAGFGLSAVASATPSAGPYTLSRPAIPVASTPKDPIPQFESHGEAWILSGARVGVLIGARETRSVVTQVLTGLGRLTWETWIPNH